MRGRSSERRGYADGDDQPGLTIKALHMQGKTGPAHARHRRNHSFPIIRQIPVPARIHIKHATAKASLRASRERSPVYLRGSDVLAHHMRELVKFTARNQCPMNLQKGRSFERMLKEGDENQ